MSNIKTYITTLDNGDTYYIRVQQGCGTIKQFFGVTVIYIHDRAAIYSGNNYENQYNGGASKRWLDTRSNTADKLMINAIETYVKNNGYADMNIAEYLAGLDVVGSIKETFGQV